jgi:hypothetical protein
MPFPPIIPRRPVNPYDESDRVARRRLEAEVERLNDEIIEMRNLWGRDQRRAEKSEAEVERLNNGCRCRNGLPKAVA